MSRRPEGGVYRRGHNSFQLKTEGPPRADGKRNTVRKTVRAASEAEALKLLREWQVEIDTGRLVERSSTTLVGAVSKTIADTQHGNFEERCRTIVRIYVEPYFKTKRLQDIQPVDITEWQEWLRQQRTKQDRPLAAKTLRQISKVVRQTLVRAVKDRKLPWNPAADIPLPRDERKEMALPSPAELNDLPAKLAAHPWPMFRRLAPLAYCALRIGARRGELLALRWSDFDLDTGTCRIMRSFVEEKRVNEERKLTIVPCKTEKSRRIIGIGPELIAYLRRYRIEQAARLLAQGRRPTADDLVFDDGAGNPLWPKNVSSDWVKAKRMLGFDLNLHGLRHAHASLAIKTKQFDPLQLSRRHGHANTRVTFDIYGHLFNTDDREEAGAIETLLLRGAKRPT
jgi:integrase